MPPRPRRPSPALRAVHRRWRERRTAEAEAKAAASAEQATSPQPPTFADATARAEWERQEARRLIADPAFQPHTWRPPLA